MGITLKGLNYLHPEEALYLMEKDQIDIIDTESSDTSLLTSAFYIKAISSITLPAYLVYMKLKVLLPSIFDSYRSIVYLYITRFLSFQSLNFAVFRYISSYDSDNGLAISKLPILIDDSINELISGNKIFHKIKGLFAFYISLFRRRLFGS